MKIIDNFTEQELKEEVWKDIPGYEGIYQISTLGRVRSSLYHKEPVILQTGKNKIGYRIVALNKDKKQHSYSLHRLVALTFIPNPDNLPEVMHLDNNKLNCRVSNLKWGTHQENISMITDYSARTAKQRATMIKNGTNYFGKKGRKIRCINTGKIYRSSVEASKDLNLFQSSIHNCANGKIRQTGGYSFEFAE